MDKKGKPRLSDLIPKSEELVQVNFRLPKSLLEKVKAVAEKKRFKDGLTGIVRTAFEQIVMEDKDGPN